MPMTNSGSAARTSVTVEVTWSTGLSRFIAVQTPIAIDSGIAMIDATKTRNAEFATRSESSCVTGCCVAAESPRLNVRMPLSHCGVLRHHRLVEVQLIAQRRDAVGRRLLAEDRGGRVARQGDDRREHDSETSHSVRIPRPIRRRINLLDTAGLPAVRARRGLLHGWLFSFMDEA